MREDGEIWRDMREYGGIWGDLEGGIHGVVLMRGCVIAPTPNVCSIVNVFINDPPLSEYNEYFEFSDNLTLDIIFVM